MPTVKRMMAGGHLSPEKNVPDETRERTHIITDIEIRVHNRYKSLVSEKKIFIKKW